MFSDSVSKMTQWIWEFESVTAYDKSNIVSFHIFKLMKILTRFAVTHHKTFQVLSCQSAKVHTSTVPKGPSKYYVIKGGERVERFFENDHGMITVVGG